MKIQATIKTEETIEFEVEIPYFCKFSDKLYKVVSDKEAIEIDPSESYTKILKKGLWLCESDVAQGQRIEETEFNEAYHKALFEIGKYVPAPDTPKELNNGDKLFFVGFNQAKELIAANSERHATLLNLTEVFKVEAQCEEEAIVIYNNSFINV